MSLVDLVKNVFAGPSGVMAGIVTNNQDPAGLGRVRVRFPVREGKDDSCWARIATLMAGKERGSFFLPEVDDEVLVAFERGNAKHPYVIGGLWNSEDKPPETNSDGKNNIRKIRSRSGHEIVFNDDDEGQQEKVVIQTKGGHVITLDDSSDKEKLEIKDNTGNNSITIDSTQNAIEISSARKLSLRSQLIEIDADATLKIRGALVSIN